VSTTSDQRNGFAMRDIFLFSKHVVGYANWSKLVQHGGFDFVLQLFEIKMNLACLF
jgi:hypothetical protein